MADDESPPVVDVDEYLEMIGEFGKMQILLQVMFCLLVFVSTYDMLSIVFVGNSPSWKCTGFSSECNDTSIVFDIHHQQYQMRCQLRNRSSWEFTQQKGLSIVTEWDLVCDKKILAYLASSAVFFGRGIGTLVNGYISDRFGRKKVLFPSMAAVIVCGFSSAFVQNIWQFLVLRCMFGFANIGVIVTTFTLAVELVGPRYRVLSGTIIWFLFCTAFIMMASQAWLLPDWRKLELILSAPYVFVLLFWKPIPESIRWLRVNGRINAAENILKRIAKTNGKPIPNAKLSFEEKNKNKKTTLDLFHPCLRFKSTIMQCFLWFITSLVSNGVSIASADLSGNIYQDFILVNIVSIPAYLVTIYMGRRFGRKFTTISAMITAGISCIGIAVIPVGSDNTVYYWSQLMLAMFGKFSSEVASSQVWVWSSEIFPTVVRTQGMALVTISNSIGGSASSWVAQFLKHFHAAAPFTVMGCLAIISGILSLMLPETKGMATAEVLGNGKDETGLS